MSELSQLANVAEILGVIIVVGGLFFALLQMRQTRQQRRELAAIELFRFFGNPQFTSAYRLVLRLPDNLTVAEIQGDRRLEEAAVLISATMENIGVMTYQRIVPFVVVRNLVGASAPVLWRKLSGWVQELRNEQEMQDAYEWFQWLAERLEQFPSADKAPAYVAHRDWIPAHLKHQIGSE